MDKRIVGLLGAAAALTTVSGVQAATSPQATQLAPAANYADLLQPVPNAAQALKADDARRSEAPGVQVAQVSVQIGHHHHHRYYRGHHHHHRYFRHHHHHHHHHGVYIR